MRAGLIRGLLAGACLALIGYGAWLVYPPAGPLTVGLLVWVDLSRESRRHEHNRKHPGA